MNRISGALVAAFLLAVIGCGDERRSATAEPETEAPVAPLTPATSAAAPPAPREPTSEITVRRDPSGGDYRDGGRSWRGCGATVYNSETGYDLYGISVSGPAECAAAITVFKALAKYVQQHQTEADDCFPGYCNADDRQTIVVGYRCKATDHGDESISLSIVCHNGNRYVSAGAADDE